MKNIKLEIMKNREVIIMINNYYLLATCQKFIL